MRIQRTVGLCLLLTAMPLVAESSESTVRIEPNFPDAVTVFEDRARVHRRSVVDVITGTNEIKFVALPSSLDPSSVRARLRGVPGLVLGVRLEREIHLEDVQEEVRLLVKKMQQLEDQLSASQFRMEELDRRREITLRLAKILEDSISNGGADLFAGVTSAEVISAQQWVSDRLLEITLEKDRLNLQRADIEKNLSDLSSDLQPLQESQGSTTWLATVLIQAQESGEAIIELAHDVFGANWVPIHEAILNESEGTVQWRSKAQVVQRSGEDWTGVELTLSTARSSLGLAPPSLVPIRVSPISIPADSRGIDKIAVPASEKDIELFDSADSRGRGMGQVDNEPVMAGAVVSRGSGPARFEIRAPATIPADGSNHSVLISEQTLSADLGYQSVPLLSPHVYRRAHLINSGQAPLLAGTVRCFRDGAYVGDGTVDRIAAGQKFSQHFGTEGRIVVHKEEIEDRSTKAGSFSDDVKLVKSHRITISSMISDPVQLELVDRIPVSSVEGVEVILGKETTPEPEVEKDGIVRWSVSLVKDQQAVFVLQWIATAEKEDSGILEGLR